MGKTWFCAPSYCCLLYVYVYVYGCYSSLACRMLEKSRRFVKYVMPRCLRPARNLYSLFTAPLFTQPLSLSLSRQTVLRRCCHRHIHLSFTRCKSRRSVHLQCFASLCDTRAGFDVLCTSDHAWQDTSHDLSCAKQFFCGFVEEKNIVVCVFLLRAVHAST